MNQNINPPRQYCLTSERLFCAICEFVARAHKRKQRGGNVESGWQCRGQENQEKCLCWRRYPHLIVALPSALFAQMAYSRMALAYRYRQKIPQSETQQ